MDIPSKPSTAATYEKRKKIHDSKKRKEKYIMS
jgi:hypothetical protein